MQRVLADHQPSMDAIAMVAAVADLRRVESSEAKVSKHQLPELLATGWSQVPDLLAALSRRRPHGQTLLGFAALAAKPTKNSQSYIGSRTKKEACEGQAGNKACVCHNTYYDTNHS